jgi:ATP-binding protein involved in chromosome partitioning
VDPRISIVDERLKGVRRIIAVSGGKGGVGKSLFASTFALILAERGFRVGLFDLDFTSPSTHVVLGVGDLRPKEDKGVLPPRVHGLEYMSIVYYSGNHAAPLRGADVSNALIELLSIVKWGKLDYLILDMPPGISDATLDMIRLIHNIEFLIVTTPSKLAFETVKKLVGLLEALRIPVLGLVENMKMTRSRTLQREARMLDLNLLGTIPYDTKIEEAVGKKDALMKTTFARRAKRIATKINES